MRITTENYEKVLRLTAKPKIPQVDYPSLINFGKVSIGEVIERSIMFRSDSDIVMKLESRDEFLSVADEEIDVLSHTPVEVRV